jgi:hypothetical protein
LTLGDADLFIKGRAVPPSIDSSRSWTSPSARRQLAAIKEVLERNKLYAYGSARPMNPTEGSADVCSTSNTSPLWSRSTRTSRAMTDAELADYRNLLAELKALMPAEVPKAIEVQD